MHLSSVRSFLTLGCAARLRPVIAGEPELLPGFTARLRDIKSRAAPDVGQMTSTFTRGYYSLNQARQRAAQAGAQVEVAERLVHHDPSSRSLSFTLRTIDHTRSSCALMSEGDSASKNFRLQERPLPDAQASAGPDNDSGAHVGPFVVPKAVLDILHHTLEEHNDVIRQRAGRMEAHPPGDPAATSHSRPATPLSRQGSSTSFGTANSSGSVNSRKASTEAYGLGMLHAQASTGNQIVIDGRSPAVPVFPESDSEDNASTDGTWVPSARPEFLMGRDIRTSAVRQSVPVSNDGGSPAGLVSLSKEQYDNLLAQVPPQDHERVIAGLNAFEQDLHKMFANHLCFFGDRDTKALESFISNARSSRSDLHSMMEKIYGPSLGRAMDAMVQHYRDDNEEIIESQNKICLEVNSRLLKELPDILNRQLTDSETFDASATRLLTHLGTTYINSLKVSNPSGKFSGVQGKLFKTLQADARAILEAHRASLANQRTAADTNDNPAADPADMNADTDAGTPATAARWPRLHQAWQWVKTRAALGSAAGSLG